MSPFRPFIRAILFILFAFSITNAQEPDLQLPYMAGDTWSCSQGWNGSFSHSGEAALDFNYV